MNGRMPIITHRRPNTREVDSQRTKVYTAENVLDAHKKNIADEKALLLFVRRVQNNAALLRRYPELEKYITAERKHHGAWSHARSDKSTIRIAPQHMNDWIVLHEISHIVADRRHGWQVAGHGREFCLIYLDLVKFVMGRDAHAALKESFDAAGVKYKLKKASKPMSDERKEQLKQQLAEARRIKQEKNNEIR